MTFITIRQGEHTSIVACKTEHLVEITLSWQKRGWKVSDTEADSKTK